ncbi:glycosyltransferase, partial [Streptococcus danieliae]|nr:glycosyltransferase [Streptococcus danieliae]
VLLEAKQFGIPIVSFNCQTGPSEIIRHGINGYLVEDFNLNLMENRINELISDEEKRRQFSQNSYLDIEKFSKEEILQQWKDLIK